VKSLTKKEFQNECLKFKHRGKCAVLLHKDKKQNLGKVNLVYENNKVLYLELLKEFDWEYVSAILVNFEISSNFTFLNVEEIMNQLFRYIPNEIDLVFTVTYNELKSLDEAKITLVVSKDTTLRILLSKIFNRL